MIDSRKTMAERMALSAMRKYNLQNTKYSYKSAIMLEGMYKAATVLNNREMFDYVKNFLEKYVHEDGTVEVFKLEDYSMDNIRMGYIMLKFYALTGDQRYKKGLDQFMEMLKGQPRTPEGGFWHKKRYTNQMWLDGLFMQGPVYAGYCKMFGGLKECLDDIIAQFELIYSKTYDPATGLLRHAWDSSRTMPWCDHVTGQSQEVWARAMGWYCWAIADLLEDIPDEPKYSPYRVRLVTLGIKLADVVVKFQDKDSGMWWQVMDKGGQGKNYLETSSTSMFVYFLAKMHRLGHLDATYLEAAKRGFDGMCALFVTEGDSGEIYLHNVCKSAGLGRAEDVNSYRPADFKYYTETEPRLTDNLHGVSPFIHAALELEFPAQMNTKKYILKPGEDINKVLSDNAGKAAVIISKGTYRVGPIDIPAHTHLLFEEGAVLDFTDNFDAYEPVQTRWEGVNCWAMHPCFFIRDAEDVVVEGPGVLDGNGERWWNHIMKWKNGGRPAGANLPCEKRLAELNPDFMNQPEGGGGRPTQFLRPALLQILNSKNVRIDGVRLTRSPFWTLHPICVTNLILQNITIENPYDSPNTDGIDIESCVNVDVRGCDVNVGDDGIAVKCGSGKEMMAFQRSENINVEDCTVRNAHGGFVIGSETASGVRWARVRNCRFIGTDRGIRIKTRRRRGGLMCDIEASDIYMKNVICPISINMFYHCGSDEPNLYSLEKQPVSEDTPVIANVKIDRIRAVGVRSMAAFLAGLPESPLKNITVRNSSFHVLKKVEKGLEAEMCSGIPATDYRGIRVINADAVFENVKVNTEPQVLFEQL